MQRKAIARANQFTPDRFIASFRALAIMDDRSIQNTPLASNARDIEIVN